MSCDLASWSTARGAHDAADALPSPEVVARAGQAAGGQLCHGAHVGRAPWGDLHKGGGRSDELDLHVPAGTHVMQGLGMEHAQAKCMVSCQASNCCC